MRQKGRAVVSQRNPQALAVCDRCSFMYNHRDLDWQFQWRGTTLQNIRILVCQDCMDIPQEQLRVIVLPPDPVPIANARPEQYVTHDNPLSGVGANPNFFRPTLGGRIGNLTEGGGLNAAFDGNSNKIATQSAMISVSKSSYNNFVGINWAGENAATAGMASSLRPPVIRHSLVSFTLKAPKDQPFLASGATSYLIQSSPTNTSVYGAWTTISSGTTSSAAGQEITGTCTGGAYQFHRVAFLGDGTNPIAVAQVELNVAQTGQPATSGSA